MAISKQESRIFCLLRKNRNTAQFTSAPTAVLNMDDIYRALKISSGSPLIDISHTLPMLTADRYDNNLFTVGEFICLQKILFSVNVEKREFFFSFGKIP